jgi:general secretion pathway protein C
MAAITGKDLLLLCQQPAPGLRAAIHVVLILLLTYSLAQMSWQLLPAPGQAPLLPTPVSAAKKSASSGNGMQSHQIAGWHLFGEAVVEALAPRPAELPETNLKLTLRGLLASTIPAEARAIVADPSGKENFYKIGDKLPGNAELSEIHSDRIVIQRGGRYETLKLPKESLDVSVNSTRNARNATAALTRRRNATAVAPRQTYSLKQYRDTLLTHPNKVADLVGIAPVYNNGHFQGYRLQPGRDATFLTRYGLMPGDIVTSVNGVVLDNPAKGLGLLKDLTTVDTLELEINRNGSRQRFTLPVN